jgi:DnaJ-class molecular chaperone
MSDEPMKPGDEAPTEEPAAAPNECPDCGGSGRRDGGTCETCRGTGEVSEAVGGG